MWKVGKENNFKIPFSSQNLMLVKLLFSRFRKSSELLGNPFMGSFII